jgi:hypothetical protein
MEVALAFFNTPVQSGTIDHPRRSPAETHGRLEYDHFYRPIRDGRTFWDPNPVRRGGLGYYHWSLQDGHFSRTLTQRQPVRLLSFRTLLLLTLLAGQTANENHQRRRVVFSKLLSECRHFTFDPAQDGGLNSFVGLRHLVEIWPFVSSGINAVAMRTIKGKQLCASHDFRIFARAALCSWSSRGHRNVGLNNARRSQESSNNGT